MWRWEMDFKEFIQLSCFYLNWLQTEIKTRVGRDLKTPKLPQVYENTGKNHNSRVISLHTHHTARRDCFHWLCQKDKMVIYVLA